MKTLSSPILFKQIIGRGSRLDPGTDKYWFRIIDYTGATRLFDEWDRPPISPPGPPVGPQTAILVGSVFHVDTGERIVGAKVSVRTGPNSQQGPIVTDENGCFRFSQLPAGRLQLIVNVTGFVGRTISAETIADETVEVDVPLKLAKKGGGKIRVEGLEVTIADGQSLLLKERENSLPWRNIETTPDDALSRRRPRRVICGQSGWIAIAVKPLLRIFDNPAFIPRCLLKF